jgi:hypothetical protein
MLAYQLIEAESVMDLSQSELEELMMVPAALILFGLIFIVVLAVQGYSMKWSVNLVDAGPIGFFYGLLTSIVISIGGGITSVGIALATGTTNQWVLVLYSMTAAVVILALMVQCNPFKAFFAYLCHAVFSTIGCIGVAIAAVLMMFILSKANLIELPKNSPATMGPAKSGWGAPAPATQNTQFITGGGGGLQTNPFSQ